MCVYVYMYAHIFYNDIAKKYSNVKRNPLRIRLEVGNW